MTKTVLMTLVSLQSLTLALGCDDGGSSAGDDDGSSDSDSDSDADSDADGPFVEILSPADGEEVPNPVTFEFEAGGGVVTVAFECDDWPLQDEPLPAGQGSHTYEFSATGIPREVLLIGFDEDGEQAAQDEVTFTPYDESCAILPQPGFNAYTVAAINDWTLYPKDGTYPYCWSYYGDTCGDMWGQIHDGLYIGELLFAGGGDCFCSGHTLEIFLRAYQLWQIDHDAPQDLPFTHDDAVLDVDSVDVGEFYQYWQGFGVTDEASAADAFENAGIGENIYEESWDEALPGDYVNLSRSTGSGHAVIFLEWVEEEGEKIGLRYYGCNGSGDSCPDPDDEANTGGNSGPSYVTEYFDGHGGTVLPGWLFIGRVFMPEQP